MREKAYTHFLLLGGGSEVSVVSSKRLAGEEERIRFSAWALDGPAPANPFMKFFGSKLMMKGGRGRRKNDMEGRTGEAHKWRRSSYDVVKLVQKELGIEHV